jgi:AraC family transcriptional regulator
MPTRPTAVRSSPAPDAGVRGQALRRQATGELSLALLRPTIPEHGIQRHQHEDMHLILLLAGDYVSDAAGMPGVCTEPALILNPPGTEHRDWFRSRDGRFLVLAMPGDAYARLYYGVRADDRPSRLPRQSVGRAMRLLREMGDWDQASSLAVELVLGDLVADAQAAPAAAAPDDRLQRVRDRLEDDASPLPGLRDLAALAGLHPVYLARAFRKRYGLSPSDYVRKRRLHRALSLIARQRPLAQAASALGFVDQSHLHRCFVAEFGLTPGAFRRLALGRAEVSRIQDAQLPG